MSLPPFITIVFGPKLPRLVPFRRYEVITSVVAPTAQAAEDDGWMDFWGWDFLGWDFLGLENLVDTSGKSLGLLE